MTYYQQAGLFVFFAVFVTAILLCLACCEDCPERWPEEVLHRRPGDRRRHPGTLVLPLSEEEAELGL